MKESNADVIFDRIIQINFHLRHISFHIISVCKSYSGKVCNRFGVAGDCDSASRKGCGQCKDGYHGEQCQFCIGGPKFTIFEGVNGKVDSETGKGIWCGM